MFVIFKACALAAKWNLFVLPREIYLFLFCKLISLHSLYGWIFVILVSFGGFRCDVCFPFRHLTDVPPKFYKGSKTATFGAILSCFSNHRPDWTAIILKQCIFRNAKINLFCADDWVIMSWNLVKVGTPIAGIWAPKCAKMVIRKLISLKRVKIEWYYMQVESSAMSLVSSSQILQSSVSGFSKITRSVEVPPSR